MYARIAIGSGHRISEVQIRFYGVRGVQIEQAGHGIGCKFLFFSFEKGN